jgi:hypothetical protein
MLSRSGADPALRLRHLWLAYLLAMLFHVELGLMPLFHGISPAIESQVKPEHLPLLFWAMLLYFLVPLACLLLLAYAPQSGEPPPTGGLWRRWRGLHLGLSIFYTITNIPHLIADILVPDSRSDQVFLMLVLLLIGLLINREAWLWWRQLQRAGNCAGCRPRGAAPSGPPLPPRGDRGAGLRRPPSPPTGPRRR